MENKNSRVRNNNVLSLVQTSLMTAMIYVATAVINIPYAGDGVVHLGDAMLFIAAIIIGKKRGAVAAGIGMFLFDVFSPYAVWAPYTLVIKGTMAFIAGAIAYRDDYKGENLLNNLFAFIIAGIWMIAGYFGASLIIQLFVKGDAANLSAAIVVATTKIPGDIAQVVAGIIIALPVCQIFKKNKMFSR